MYESDVFYVPFNDFLIFDFLTILAWNSFEDTFHGIHDFGG